MPLKIHTTKKLSFINLNGINIDIPIYRFLNVDHLFQLFESKLLTLVSPKLWDDPYENFLDYSYGTIPSKPNVQISFEGYASLLFGQCWTFTPETDATWRIYSPNKSKVKIKTTIGQLSQLIKPFEIDFFSSYIGKVKYLPESDSNRNIVEALKKASLNTQSVIEEFFYTKRDTFTHENELRLLIKLKTENNKFQDMNLCHIPIEDPIDFIDEIIFDPRMADSLVSAYSSHLKNKYNFNKNCKKSTIYRKLKIEVELDLDLPQYKILKPIITGV